jgi:hypothetical protein
MEEIYMTLCPVGCHAVICTESLGLNSLEPEHQAERNHPERQPVSYSHDFVLFLARS